MPALTKGWELYGIDDDVRRLILMMIDAGRLSDGIEIARDAASGRHSCSVTRLWGIRALGVVGESADLEALASTVEEEAATLDASVVWELLSSTFPKHLSVEGFVSVLSDLEKAGDPSHQFDWRGKQLVDRLKARDDLKKMTSALLPLTEEEDEDEIPKPRFSGDRKLRPLLQSAASGLLKLLPVRTSDEIIIDAAVKLAGDSYGGRRFEDKEFGAMLQASPERRRIGLWRAVELLKDHRRLQRIGLTNVWQLEFAGWSAGLREQDSLGVVLLAIADQEIGAGGLEPVAGQEGIAGQVIELAQRRVHGLDRQIVERHLARPLKGCGDCEDPLGLGTQQPGGKSDVLVSLLK